MIDKILSIYFKCKKELSKEFILIKSPEGTYLTATKYTFPFLYIVCDDFFSNLKYKELSEMLYYLDTTDLNNLSYVKIYDVYSAKIKLTNKNNPLGYFFSYNLYDNIRTLLKNYNISLYTMNTIHVNTPKSNDKYIHTDYNYNTFPDYDIECKSCNDIKDTVLVNYNENINKSTKDRMRAAVSIFYFNNESEYMGGETGIFAKFKDKYYNVDNVLPRNNRLLIFENSKNSYHNYKKCSLNRRKCIIN
ncbi:MAG: 2OG-Fe(II) oxygenase [Cyanobium sp. MAG06]|nr:2OG-Fe(II) oxygenase [Cyanobium sp. MAG06]